MKPKDDRNELWSEIESKIQYNATKKDSDFVLKGKWKIFLKKQDSLKIYNVNGDWIRNNLGVIFGHGGHGYVHEFIPLDEIWIANAHYDGCACNAKGPVSKAFFESTIIHEIFEFDLMKKGIPYWEAHNAALEEEKRAGFLKDPYKDE